MAIIISKDGEEARRINRTKFNRESHLQKYVYENPDVIPIYDIKEDMRLLVLEREFPTGSGPIDELGIDKDGDIYIVETKLYKNPDKRNVVAQALDYGAALWKNSDNFNDFITTQAVQKIQSFFKLTKEETQELTEKAKDNLKEGILKFVVLMDKTDTRLKDLILYINQNSQFDIYAVELEYYKDENQEIVIPKIYGAEVKKNVSGKSSSRRRWDETLLLKDAREKLSREEHESFLKIYNFSKDKASQINFGTGVNSGTFSPIFSQVCEKSLFTLGTDGRLSFNFEWVAKADERVVEVFKDKLESIGFKIPQNYKQIRPSVSSDEWVYRVGEFVNILDGIIK